MNFSKIEKKKKKKKKKKKGLSLRESLKMNISFITKIISLWKMISLYIIFYIRL